MAEMITRLTVLHGGTQPDTLHACEEQDFERSLAGNVSAMLARADLVEEWGLTEIQKARLYRDAEGNLVAFAITTEVVSSE